MLTGSSTKSDASQAAVTINTNKSMADETSLSSSSSSPADTTSLLNKPQRYLLPASERKKPRHSSLTANLTKNDTRDSSLSSLPSSIYSSMQLPIECLSEHDGCDEAELLARAKRCQEIMRLSQQAKEAEAARARAANIKPLVWAKPTFELDSTTADTASADVPAAADETQAASLGKRKER
jgi:hypothetical protein